ncbi:hypothetical protein Q9966_007957 [Columba livia]|nr:hypothetical protein Q9966_007957 [Columba livia]
MLFEYSQELCIQSDTLNNQPDLQKPPEGVEGAHVTQLPSFNVLMKELRGRNAAMTLHTSSLEKLLEDQAKDLLALLHQHGPSTEGIFLVTASERATQELREALDSGAEVHLESQPLHLLAVILQDFLRKIPSQLLQAELYQEWMSAVLKTSRQERMAGLKEHNVCMELCLTGKLWAFPCWTGQHRVVTLCFEAQYMPRIGGKEESVKLGSMLPRNPCKLPVADAKIKVAMTLHSWSLEQLLEDQAKDLLALLHQHGPSTEGIFLVTASERATQELREALDSGAEVHLESQPLHLLAVILQDFLRKIPSQLLQAELYQEWMSAVLKTSRQERMAGLKEPPEGVEGAHVTQLPSFNVLMKELRGRNAAMTLHTSSLEKLLEDQAKDLLALLHQHGPSTEGIFLVTASERATQELREALDSGAEVHLESQPLHLLAVILQDFLRKIPSQLLQAELYQEWMSAVLKTSRQERMAGLKEPPEGVEGAHVTQLPSFNVLMKELRGRNAAMTLHSRSLEQLLEDQAKDLLALLHQHGPSTEGIFLVTASEQATQELREALDSGAEVHLESQPLHLLAVILQDFLRKIPSQLLQAELYQEWMSAVLKTSRQERMAGLKEPPEGVEGAHVTQLPSFNVLMKELRGRNAAMTLHSRSLEQLLEDQAKDLLALLHQHGPSTEGIFLVTASERATQELREALDSGAEVHLESQPLHLLAVILQDFLRKIPSQLLQAELYQEWMSAVLKTSRQERMAGLRGPPEGVEGAHVTQLPSFNVLMKELRGRNAAMTLHSRSLNSSLRTRQRLVQSSGHHPASPPTAQVELATRLVSLGKTGAGWPFSPPLADGHSCCVDRGLLFGRPLAALCSQDGTLPQTIQDLLALLHQHGPSTEGIFLVTASERATQELREALDSGAEVHLESQPLHLLAIILQDFLRKIPSQLLQAELYQEWMSAVLKTSRQERMAGLKEPPEGVEGAHVTQLPSFNVLMKELRGRNAAMTLHSRSLEQLLEDQAKDLLALLHQHGPSTEGIFLVTASERATQELREALDSGAEVHLESQPLHLLAVILQDFLRKIPSQLLQAELYQEWMSAVLKTSRQERMAGLREPPEGVEGAHVTQLPSFNVLMKELRGRNAAMTLHSRSLEQLLEDQAKDLLALLHQHGPSTEGIFLVTASERATQELREALDSGAEVHLESQPLHLLAVILQDFLRKIPSQLLQAELYQEWMSAVLKTSRQERMAGLKEPPEGVEGARVTQLPSFRLLLKVLRGRNATGSRVALDLPRPFSHQGTPGCVHKGFLFGRPLAALCSQDGTLPQTIQDLLALLHQHGPSTEGIFLVTASERATQELREALDSGAEVHLESQPLHLLAVILQDFLRKIPSQLLQAELYQEWMSAVLKTSRQERMAELKDKLEEAVLLDLCSLSLASVMATTFDNTLVESNPLCCGYQEQKLPSKGSCHCTFPVTQLPVLQKARVELQEFPLHIPPEGVEGARVTQLPSFNVLMKELRGRNAAMTLDTMSLEQLLEDQAKAGAEQRPPPGVPSGSPSGVGHSAAGRTSTRRRGLPRPFLRRVMPGCVHKGLLFGRPLAALCSQDGTLPQTIQDLLALLHQHGPSTEGIFLVTASERATQELREALDSGAEVHLESQPLHLLAVILQDFLRKIPSQLLQAELYQEWMSAVLKTSRQERMAGLKELSANCKCCEYQDQKLPSKGSCHCTFPVTQLHVLQKAHDELQERTELQEFPLTTGHSSTAHPLLCTCLHAPPGRNQAIELLRLQLQQPGDPS